MGSSPFTELACPMYGKDNSQLLLDGYIDSMGNLVAAHDAVTAHLGELWRMPTAAEIAALVNNCATTWTTRNGVAGRLVSGKGAYSLKSIFLPAAGFGNSSYIGDLGSSGGFWASTPYYSNLAYHLHFGSNEFYLNENPRHSGRPVRPVRGFAEMKDVAGCGVTTHFLWDPLVCMVVFDANGGFCETPSEQYFNGLTLGILPTPTRSGYVFDGWYTAASGGTQALPTDVVTGDVILYAHWRNFISVMFNANGGSQVVSSSYQVDVPYGEMPLTARKGFRLLGWFTEVVGGDLVAEDSIVDTDRTLYAHWDRYAYDFKWLGGGKLDICTGTRRTDEVQGIAMDSAWVNGGARAVVSVDGVEKAESKGADEFVWRGNETKEYTLKHQVYDAQGRAVGEPYTAKIAWTSRAAVTFDGGNGEEAFSREYDESYAYGELPSVTKTGHAFAGWYTAAEGGEKVEAGAQFDGSVSKLYAHWTVNQYGVKFDKNGGEGTAGDLTVAYGDVVPMEGVAFRKSGYRLAGWATAADGAAVYGQGGAMSNLTAEANGSVQLYAVWEPTTVDLRSFKQRYPWNGFVDVECEVGAEGRVGLMLIDEASGTNFTAKTLFCQGGSVTNSALWMAEGPQKFIWDAGSDLPDGFKTSKLKAKTYFVEGEE